MKTPAELDKITDTILAYHPKPKTGGEAAGSEKEAGGKAQ